MTEHPDSAFRLEVDAGDEAFAVDVAEMDGNVDGHENQAADDIMTKAAAFRRGVNHQRDLFIGHQRGIGVTGSDGTRMTVAAGADEVIGFIPPDFRQDNAVGLHAQTGFQTAFRGHGGIGAEILRIEQVHLVGVVDEDFPCVLDGNDAFFMRNQTEQGLHEGRFSATGRAGDNDVLAVIDGRREKFPIFLFV